MAIQKQLEELLETEVTRREFLARAGLAVLALLGLPAIIGILTGNQSRKVSSGYGSEDYGP